MTYPDPRHNEDNFYSWLDNGPFDWEHNGRKNEDDDYDLVTIRFYVLRNKD